MCNYTLPTPEYGRPSHRKLVQVKMQKDLQLWNFRQTSGYMSRNSTGGSRERGRRGRPVAQFVAAQRMAGHALFVARARSSIDNSLPTAMKLKREQKSRNKQLSVMSSSAVSSGYSTAQSDTQSIHQKACYSCECSCIESSPKKWHNPSVHDLLNRHAQYFTTHKTFMPRILCDSSTSSTIKDKDYYNPAPRQRKLRKKKERRRNSGIAQYESSVESECDLSMAKVQHVAAESQRAQQTLLDHNSNLVSFVKQLTDELRYRNPRSSRALIKLLLGQVQLYSQRVAMPEIMHCLEELGNDLNISKSVIYEVKKLVPLSAYHASPFDALEMSSVDAVSQMTKQYSNTLSLQSTSTTSALDQSNAVTKETNGYGVINLLNRLSNKAEELDQFTIPMHSSMADNYEVRKSPEELSKTYPGNKASLAVTDMGKMPTRKQMEILTPPVVNTNEENTRSYKTTKASKQVIRKQSTATLKHRKGKEEVEGDIDVMKTKLIKPSQAADKKQETEEINVKRSNEIIENIDAVVIQKNNAENNEELSVTESVEADKKEGSVDNESDVSEETFSNHSDSNNIQDESAEEIDDDNSTSGEVSCSTTQIETDAPSTARSRTLESWSDDDQSIPEKVTDQSQESPCNNN